MKKQKIKRIKVKMVYIVILILILSASAILFSKLQKTQEERLNDLNLTKDFCIQDSDCICDGVDIQTKVCFIGNMGYYNKYVDRSKACPDFCTGISGNLKTACVNNTCKLIKR